MPAGCCPLCKAKRVCLSHSLSSAETWFLQACLCKAENTCSLSRPAVPVQSRKHRWVTSTAMSISSQTLRAGPDDMKLSPTLPVLNALLSVSMMMVARRLVVLIILYVTTATQQQCRSRFKLLPTKCIIVNAELFGKYDAQHFTFRSRQQYARYEQGGTILFGSQYRVKAYGGTGGKTIPVTQV